MSTGTGKCSTPPILFSASNVQWRSGPKQGVLIEGEIKIRAGRMTAVIGDSGSGKTTFLNLLAGFIKAEKADRTRDATLELRVPGSPEPRVINLLKGPPAARHRRHLGFVFQASHLLKNAVCTANLVLPNAIHGLRIDHARLTGTLHALFEPEEKGGNKSDLKHNCRVRVFSGGESQRIAAGRAVFHSPSIVLADEPTGSLDKKRGQALMSFLRQWCYDAPGRSVVWVTHSLDDVCEYADDVIVLHENRLSPSLATWPAANPGDVEVLSAWQGGLPSPVDRPRIRRSWCLRPSTRKLGTTRMCSRPGALGRPWGRHIKPRVRRLSGRHTPEAQSAPANGANRRLLEALGEPPARVPLYMRLLPSRLPLKLALAEVFGGHRADDSEKMGALNKVLGFTPGWFNVPQFGLALSQSPRAFSRLGVLLALLLSLFIFFAVTQAKTVFGVVFAAMQNDPDVAYVLAEGSTLTPDYLISSENIDKFRDSFAACLLAGSADLEAKCKTDASARETGGVFQEYTAKPKIFGRWVEREGPELAISESNACDESLNTVPARLRLSVKLLAADREEPAMTSRFSKATPAEAAGDANAVPILILTENAKQKLRDRYNLRNDPYSLCLKLLGEWRQVQLGQGQTELPPDPDFRDLDAAVTAGFYQFALANTQAESADVLRYRYKRIAIYFQPLEIPTVREWASLNHQALHPEAFKKIERLMALTSNAESMIGLFFYGTLIFIGSFMFVIFSNYILSNEKFFCVLRAFGAGYFFIAQMIVYQILMLCGIACGLFLLILWPLNDYVWPKLAKSFELPANTPDLLDAAHNAFPWFLGLGAGAGLLLTWAWIIRNKYIGDRLKAVG